MINQTMNQSRLSYSYIIPALATDNPLMLKATRLSLAFDKQRDPLRAAQYEDMKRTEADRRGRAAFKAKRRDNGSEMIKRQNPHPELKPSPQLAHASDAQAFNRQWRNESRIARRTNLIAEGRAILGELHQHKVNLGQAKHQNDALAAQARGGDVKGATREAFKLIRRAEAESARVISKAQTVQQKLTDT